jgi:hypothetical protein
MIALARGSGKTCVAIEGLGPSKPDHPKWAA